MSLPAYEYQVIFHHSPIAKLVVFPDSPTYTILDVNQAYLDATGSQSETLVGRPAFLVFPKSPDDEDARFINRSIASFDEALHTKKRSRLENYRYDIPLRGTDRFIEKYWTAINTPVLDENGEVKYIIHSPTDVTEQFNMQKKLYSIFMQAPVGIGIFRGPDYIVDLINPSLAEIYGKSETEMLGKPVFDVLIQAKGQGFEEKLDAVRLTGKSFQGKGVEVPLIRNGILEKVYVDFAYVPFYEENESVNAVIAIATEVTSQVLTMHQLEEAEERARLAADAVAMGTYDLNLLTGEIITSQRFAHIFGFDRPMSREEYLQAVHPEDRIVRQLAHEEAIEKGIMMYEARAIMSDASTRWVKVEGKVLYDKSGNPVRMLGTLIDVTDEKWNKELQKKLNTLIEHSVDLMSILNLEGTNTYINAAGMNLLGFTSTAQALGTPLSAIHPEEDLRFLKEKVWPMVLKNGDWAGNIHIKTHPQGTVIPVFNHYIRIDDPITEVPIAIGVVMRDLRPELTAKQALADSEHLLRNITSASPTALWMADANGEVSYVNQTWVDWSKKPFKENLGKGWLSIINPEDQKRVYERFQQSITKQTHYEVEFRIMHAGENPRWCVALGQPQYNKAQEFTGFIGSCTDITEHKELQTQKDNFIGIASHELKTPVTSLKGYTQVLERTLRRKGHDLEASMMKKMDAQLDRLTSLIRDLLDVTKVNTGKMVLHEEPFDLAPVLLDLIEDLQRTTQRHILVHNLKTSGQIYADKDRIEQVIINLLTNAIKYSPEAEQIIIHCEETQDNVIVSVQDFGVGIAKENQEKVFEQFYRVSGEKQHTFPGMGLGLYISSEIIQRAGGRIWVESSEGRGARFYFSLPLHKTSSGS